MQMDSMTGLVQSLKQSQNDLHAFDPRSLLLLFETDTAL